MNSAAMGDAVACFCDTGLRQKGEFRRCFSISYLQAKADPIGHTNNKSPCRAQTLALNQHREAHWDGKLILVGSVDVVGPAALHHVAVDGLVHEAWQEGGEGLLGVAVHGPEVQHLGSVQRVGQLLKRPEAASENAMSVTDGLGYFSRIFLVIRNTPPSRLYWII